MPGYNVIPDSAVDPDAPITTALMFALRDNPIAMFGAAPGAPLLNRGAINIGGSGVDGDMVDATVLSGSGLYDFNNVTLTTSHTFPILTIIRATGTVNISGAVSLTLSSLVDRIALKALGATVTGETDVIGGTPPPPNVYSNYANNYPCSYGGAAPGSTQLGVGLVSTALTRVWEWLIRRPLLGAGKAVDGGSLAYNTQCGGGALVVLADGPIIVTGSIGADGVRATSGGLSGAGGSIILISGTSIALSGATLVAAGAVDIGHGTGSAAGGYIACVAPTITGSPSVAVGADGGSNVSAPQVGLFESINTLTQAQINAILLR
jgi:hypothetical protein